MYRIHYLHFKEMPTLGPRPKDENNTVLDKNRYKQHNFLYRGGSDVKFIPYIYIYVQFSI